MDVDAFTDPALDVVAKLLFDSLRIRYGVEICTAVIKRPVTTLVELSNHQMPLLVVSRQTDTTQADDDGSDNETCTLNVEYYASLTPLPRLDLRWPSLRAVWRHCLERLHAGFDPLVTDHHVNEAGPDEDERWVPMMAAHGWRVPERPVSSVRYLLAPTAGEAQPCFQATVTLRTSDDYDWTFADTYEHPDLKGVDSVVVAHAPTPGDPDATQPGYTQEITFV